MNFAWNIKTNDGHWLRRDLTLTANRSDALCMRNEDAIGAVAQRKFGADWAAHCRLDPVAYEEWMRSIAKKGGKNTTKAKLRALAVNRKVRWARRLPRWYLGETVYRKNVVRVAVCAKSTHEAMRTASQFGIKGYMVRNKWQRKQHLPEAARTGPDYRGLYVARGGGGAYEKIESVMEMGS